MFGICGCSGMPQQTGLTSGGFPSRGFVSWLRNGRERGVDGQVQRPYADCFTR